jgi:hypothetical protein
MKMIVACATPHTTKVEERVFYSLARYSGTGQDRSSQRTLASDIQADPSPSTAQDDTAVDIMASMKTWRQH